MSDDEPAALAWLQPEWPAAPRLHAAVSLRGGGVSRSPYASLNLGAHVGDEPAHVRENRRRIGSALALPAEPLWLDQVHGNRVIEAEALPGRGGPVQADAAVARSAGQVLAVLIADCLPVLFARTDGSAIGIAHAGWRGLAGGVLEATVRALGGTPGTLQAWLGPAIGPAHFEVGEEVRAAFCDHSAQAAQAFQANARGRWQCDLHRLARQRLEALGLKAIYGTVRCTYAQPQAYFSYRRDGVTGRMAALIWLQP